MNIFMIFEGIVIVTFIKVMIRLIFLINVLLKNMSNPGNNLIYIPNAVFMWTSFSTVKSHKWGGTFSPHIKAQLKEAHRKQQNDKIKRILSAKKIGL